MLTHKRAVLVLTNSITRNQLQTNSEDAKILNFLQHLRHFALHSRLKFYSLIPLVFPERLICENQWMQIRLTEKCYENSFML